MRTMMGLLCVGVLVAGGCADPASPRIIKSDPLKQEPPVKAPNDPIPDKPETTTVTGVLRTGFAAIGGETTGWQLQSGDMEGGLEVDVRAVLAEASRLAGYKVRVTGLMTSKRYVERGMVKILVATKIEQVK